GLKQSPDIPIEKAHLSRPLTFDTLVLQIAAHSNLPGNVDQSTCRAEKPTSDSIRTFRQALTQRQSFCASYGHPLTIDRIEAAQTVTVDYEALGKAGQLFIVPALICAELIGQDWTQWFCIFDYVEYLRLRQTSREFNIPNFICRNFIVEVA